MFKKSKICTGVLLALGAAMPAMAQQQLDRVEITGSAIKRVEAEGALAVQTITRAEIARSGVVNTEQLLASIPAISSQGGISTTTGAGTSTYGRATISLRGLSDARTLVLVNGRRLAAFAGGGGAAVNVNTIPLAAIERVEVLKDGASSIYGSDAVAGVINFILSKDFQGVDLSVTTGRPSRSGGGGSDKASIVAGFGDLIKDRINVTVSASVEKEKELKARDRDFAKTGNVSPYLVAGATGLGNIEGGIDPVTGVRAPGFGGSPGAGYGNPLAAAGKCADIDMFKNPTNTTKGLPFCAFDSSPFVALLPDRDAKNLSANLTFQLDSNTQLYGDALYAKSTVTQRIQASPVRRSFLVTDAEFDKQGVVPALLLRPTNPNYATAINYLHANGITALDGQTLAITSRVFDFGNRTSRDVAEQTRVVAGARGLVLGQDFDVAFSHNESKTAGSVTDGYFSQVAYAKIVNAANSDWNPWSLTQSAAFNGKLSDAKFSGATLNAKSKSNVIDGKITGDAFSLPAGTSQYALGAQVRKESYVTSPSDALGTGDIAGLGGSVPPVNRDRRISAMFGELSVPILKTVEGTVAVRGDKYNDVGNSTTYKGSLRWQPMKTLVVRASANTGFRAPTLTDLWTPQTLGTSEQFNDPLTNQKNLQVNALSGGNPALKPEKSTQSSVGFVFQPFDALSVGIDLYQIRIKNVINSPSAQEVVSGFRSGNPAYAHAVKVTGSGDIDSIEVVTVNSGDVKTSGVDLDARFKTAFMGGKLDINLFGTYTTKFDETSPGGVISHKVGTIVDENGDPVLGANTGGVILRWKHQLSATWAMGSWAFTLAQNYASGYETGWRQIDGERNFMGSMTTYDLQVGHTGLIKNLRLALGVRNLFDKNPPGVFVPVSNQFQAGYDVTQYDARARYVYVTAGYKF
nr:TonB-dependent receptor [uncultured Roseateles sp.]